MNQQNEALEIAIRALREIAQPLGAMVERLGPGERLDMGWAVKIADSPAHLKAIALDALSAIAQVGVAE